jgi:nucleolar pre-ribosomal-associated protein 1
VSNVVQLSLSPFTSTLRFYVIVHNSNEAIIRALLCSLAREHFILQVQSTIPGFDALAVSLASFDGIDTAPRVYEFLDNCILRFIRKSIKYCGDADKFFKINRDPTSETRPVSLLHFALLEQWPFLVAANGESIAAVGDWIASYISASKAIGEDSVILQNIRTQMWQQIKDKNYGTSLKPTSNDPLSKELLLKLQKSEGAAALINKNTAESVPGDNPYKPPLVGDSVFRDLELPKEDDDHRGLNRWSMEDIATAIEGDALIDLIYCLCSEHCEVRRQALINLRHFVAKLKVCTGFPVYRLTALSNRVRRS